MFNIKDPNTFLGGQNVHNLIIIGLCVYIAFVKKQSYARYDEYKIKRYEYKTDSVIGIWSLCRLYSFTKIIKKIKWIKRIYL